MCTRELWRNCCQTEIYGRITRDKPLSTAGHALHVCECVSVCVCVCGVCRIGTLEQVNHCLAGAYFPKSVLYIFRFALLAGGSAKLRMKTGGDGVVLPGTLRSPLVRCGRV